MDKILKKINKKRRSVEEKIANFLFLLSILLITFLLVKNLLSSYTPDVVKVFLWGIVFGFTYAIIFLLLGRKK